MGATPHGAKRPGQKLASLTPEEEKAAEAKIFIDSDIDFIARSDFGNTEDGRRIVKLLKQYLKQNNIVHAKIEGDDRGTWDGKTITVNQDYYGKSFPTIVELVHEASHAIWRGDHHLTKDRPESTDEGAQNEYYAVKNQLAIYKWLRNNTNCPSDYILDRRLQYEQEGKLYDHILEEEKGNRERR